MNTSIEGKEILTVLVGKIKEMITQLNRADLLPEFHRVQQLLTPDYFGIGVVGEFSRGKSSLVNSLIGEDILPVGVMATTKYSAKVRYGAAKKIAWVDDKGSTKIASMADFNTPDAPVDSYYLLETPNERLHKANLQLIDTPGAGDLQGKWFEKTVETIAGCDATLMVVSAMMPLSQTEQKFLEQQILARQIPRLAVVITWLDQTSVNERAKIIDHIRQRIQQIAPQAVLYTVQEAAEIGTTEGIGHGVEAIFQLLENWVNSEEHPLLKAKQIKCQLTGILQALEKGLSEKQNLLDIDQKQKANDLQLRLNDLDQNRINWEDFNLAMSDRKKQTQELIRQTMEASKLSLTGKLQIELNQTDNPRQWLDTALLPYLKEEIDQNWQAIAHQVESMLQADLHWLEDEVHRRLEWHYKNTIKLDIENNLQEVKHFPKEDIQDLNQLRNLTRVGGGGVVVVSLLWSNPIGITIGVGSLLLGEWYLNKSIAQQKKELAKHIETIVDYNVANSTNDMNSRIEQTYTQIVQEIRTQENIWYKAEKQNLEKNALQQEPVSLKNQLETIKELKKELI